MSEENNYRQFRLSNPLISRCFVPVSDVPGLIGSVHNELRVGGIVRGDGRPQVPVQSTKYFYWATHRDLLDDPNRLANTHFPTTWKLMEHTGIRSVYYNAKALELRYPVVEAPCLPLPPASLTASPTIEEHQDEHPRYQQVLSYRKTCTFITEKTREFFTEP
ncbi:uncharacterized protein BJ212DRAFT_1302223 [Suillus subaureus]|uniref:Uncharacterized protein n=1 Tax=Suillus subaureus TaxID=48587 RepID=A0A9P7JAH4_9AGAM|nr:uncharacterized protein BJ212DRAFT_1302223 [Suillus subaureus]KAG1810904.1 hypothetical protein BJ212DRAFT_1302223 [Suillus subaureus]